MKYNQLTAGDRYTIAALKRQELTPTAIAKTIGRHRSTIYREYKRNRCWIIDGAYRAEKAQRRTRARRRRSRRNQHFTEKDYAIVRQLLRKGWSPEQITGHLKRKENDALAMKLFIDIFGEIRKVVALYGSTYVALKSEGVNATKLMTAAGDLPINVILQTDQLR